MRFNKVLRHPYDPITGVFEHEGFPTHTAGPNIEAADAQAQWFNIWDLIVSSALLLPTRNATGDWSLNRTAAGAETYQFNLKWPFITYDQGRDQEFFFVYQAGVVNLTSNAVTFNRTVFANGVAPAVTQPLVPAGTLATAFAATPYVTRITLPPVIQDRNVFAVYNFEWQIVMANTGTLRVYGVFARFAT